MRILVPGGIGESDQIPACWRHLVGSLLLPATWRSRETVESEGMPAAADNGAYSGFDEPQFRLLLDRWSGGPLLWVCAPDVVADAAGTLALFDHWGPDLRSLGFSVALVGQDGMSTANVPWGEFDAFFVGGTTEWKLGADARALVAECNTQGIPVHMGRVNSLERLWYARQIGCDSVDGSGYAMFRRAVLLKHLAVLARWEKQPMLF